MSFGFINSQVWPHLQNRHYLLLHILFTTRLGCSLDFCLSRYSWWLICCLLFWGENMICYTAQNLRSTENRDRSFWSEGVWRPVVISFFYWRQYLSDIVIHNAHAAARWIFLKWEFSISCFMFDDRCTPLWEDLMDGNLLSWKTMVFCTCTHLKYVYVAKKCMLCCMIESRIDWHGNTGVMSVFWMDSVYSCEALDKVLLKSFWDKMWDRHIMVCCFDKICIQYALVQMISW